MKKRSKVKTGRRLWPRDGNQTNTCFLLLPHVVASSRRTNKPPLCCEHAGKSPKMPKAKKSGKKKKFNYNQDRKKLKKKFIKKHNPRIEK